MRARPARIPYGVVLAIVLGTAGANAVANAVAFPGDLGYD
jgi:hypothetical protein